jgi:hypothetical protein
MLRDGVDQVLPALVERFDGELGESIPHRLGLDFAAAPTRGGRMVGLSGRF